MEFIEKEAKELFVSSSGLSKSGDQFGYGYPFLSYSEIFNNYYIPDELLTLVNSTEKDRKKCSIRRGDVFLTRTSETTDELGMSCVALKDYPNATFNGFAKRLRPITNEIVPEYSVYYFRSSCFRAQCMSMATLITRASLNDKMIERLRIRYPKDKDNQSKIANILMSYDKLVIANNRRIKVLEQMAENLYKEWFVRFRFPGHETTEFENGLPKDWKICKFSSVANILSGGTPKTEHDEYYGGDIPFYTPKDSTESIFVFETITKLSEDGLNHCNSQLFPQNTIMITARGTVGNLNMLAVPMAMNQSCYALNSEIISSQYFLFFLIKREIQKLKKMASGGVFDTIIVNTFDHIKVLLPTDELIKKFDCIVSSIMKEVKLLSKQNINLVKQRDLLLPRLMSGKLEV